MNKDGRWYQKTAMRDCGRSAGTGMWADDYSDESCGPVYWKSPGKVRFPHDGKKPEELNGPVIYREVDND